LLFKYRIIEKKSLRTHELRHVNNNEGVIIA